MAVNVILLQPVSAAVELANVGGTSLTDADLKGKLGNLPPVQKDFLNKAPKPQNPEERLMDHMLIII
jgi:hypothetical protein